MTCELGGENTEGNEMGTTGRDNEGNAEGRRKT